MRFMPPDDDYRFEDDPDDEEGSEDTDGCTVVHRCSYCDGEGWLDSDETIPCPECDGEGWV